MASSAADCRPATSRSWRSCSKTRPVSTRSPSRGRQPKDFTLGQIKREIERGRQIEPLYRLAQGLLPDLQISKHDPLIEATHFLKRVFTQRKPLGQYPQEAFPLAFVPETARRYLFSRDGDRQQLLPDRYEFLVYRQLRHGLEAGDVFCRFRRPFPQHRVRG